MPSESACGTVDQYNEDACRGVYTQTHAGRSTSSWGRARICDAPSNDVSALDAAAYAGGCGNQECTIITTMHARTRCAVGRGVLEAGRDYTYLFALALLRDWRVRRGAVCGCGARGRMLEAWACEEAVWRGQKDRMQRN